MNLRKNLDTTLFERVKPDVVVNFAAESHVDRSIENPEIFLRTARRMCWSIPNK